MNPTRTFLVIALVCSQLSLVGRSVAEEKKDGLTGSKSAPTTTVSSGPKSAQSAEPALDLPGAADPHLKKVGYVNFDTINNQYWKSTNYLALIKKKKADNEAELAKEFGSYQKLQDQADAMKQEFSKPSANAEEEKQRQERTMAIFKKGREEQARLDKLREDKLAVFEKYYADRTEEVLKDIKAACVAAGAEGNFDLVLNSSSETHNNCPFVIAYPGAVDITDAVMKKLPPQKP